MAERRSAAWSTADAIKQHIIDAGLQATDEGKAKEAWGKLIDLIADEVPLYPLFHRKTPTAYDKASLVDFKPISLTGLSFVGAVSYTHLTLPTNREV